MNRDWWPAPIREFIMTDFLTEEKPARWDVIGRDPDGNPRQIGVYTKDSRIAGERERAFSVLRQRIGEAALSPDPELQLTGHRGTTFL